MEDFRGKVAIVTGGASGIGRALCEELSKRGAVVVVADINEEKARQVAAGISQGGGWALALWVDVSKAEEVERLVNRVVAEEGQLDYMFNNAGIAVLGELQDMSAELWSRVIDVNLKGVAYGVQAAYPVMVSQGHGYIVNTASVAGLLPGPLAGAYGTTKYGIVGLSEALRLEGAKLGVKVSVACPGYIQSSIYDSCTYVNSDAEEMKMLMPFKPLSAEKCARAILKGMDQNKGVIPVPGYASIMWWLQRLFPSLLATLNGKIIGDFRKRRNKAVRAGRDGLLTG